jgi:hypothetical protein
MTSTSFGPKQHGFARLAVIVPLGLVALAFGAWSLYWYTAAEKTQAALAAWSAREAQAGRVWSCPAPVVGGFPFRVEISCSNATFQGTLLGTARLTGTLAQLHASAQLLAPGVLVAELDPPFVAKTSDGSLDIVSRWTKLTFEAEGTPEALARIGLVGHEVLLQGSIGNLGTTKVTMGRFDAYAVRIPERADNAYKVGLGVETLAAPTLEPVIDSAARTGLDFEGTITRADFGGPVPTADQLERWRMSNGHVEVETLEFTSGTRRLAARGVLDLDTAHRPRGRLQAEVSDFDIILQQLGVDPVILSAGAALAGLLGGKPATDETSRGLSHLQLPLSVSDGYLSVGPVQTSIQVPPLY